MRFLPLASSSHGNAYLVEDGQTRILLECGLACRTLQKALGFAVTTLDGVLLTHEHKDHSRCVEDIIKNGQSVYMSCGTALALGLAEEKPLSVMRMTWADGGDRGAHCSPLQNEDGGQIARATTGDGQQVVGTTGFAYPVNPEGAVAVIGWPGVELVEARRQFRIGTLDVVPFAVYHDAAEPLGYLVRSRKDGDVLVFATDTVNLRYRFPGLRILGIEANYQREILERSERLPEKTRKRIRNTHMEIETLCDILKGMDLRSCREIWLLHLSDAMSHEGNFINRVRRVVPPWVNVRCAAR